MMPPISCLTRLNYAVTLIYFCNGLAWTLTHDVPSKANNGAILPKITGGDDVVTYIYKRANGMAE